MKVVTVYACQVCGILSGKATAACCAYSLLKPFVIDVEAEPQTAFPDLVAAGTNTVSRAVRPEVKELKVEPEPIFREQFTPDEVDRLRKLISPLPLELPTPEPRKRWWQRG